MRFILLPAYVFCRFGHSIHPNLRPGRFYRTKKKMDIDLFLTDILNCRYSRGLLPEMFVLFSLNKNRRKYIIIIIRITRVFGQYITFYTTLI